MVTTCFPQAFCSGELMKKLEWSQHFSHKSTGIFPDAQWQLTLQSLVRSGLILYLSEMLWLSLLPASMKKIQSKMKALEYSQDFLVSCHGNQSSNPIWSKTKCNLSPTPMMLQKKFGCDLPTCLGDIHV